MLVRSHVEFLHPFHLPNFYFSVFHPCGIEPPQVTVWGTYAPTNHARFKTVNIIMQGDCNAVRVAVALMLRIRRALNEIRKSLLAKDIKNF